MEGELSRWRENAIRVALNLWLADGVGGEITAEQAERAVRIRAVVRAFVLGDPQSSAWCPEVLTGTGLRAILIETPERVTTLRDLAKRHNYDQREVRALAAEFTDLLKTGTKVPGSQGGPPSEVLTLTNSAGRFRRLVLVKPAFTEKAPHGPGIAGFAGFACKAPTAFSSAYGFDCDVCARMSGKAEGAHRTGGV